MSIEIEDAKYFSIADLVEDLSVSRQTIWRWRQEGKIPAGHLYRGRRILFTEEDVIQIREVANRIEPLESAVEGQLRLFGTNNRA